MVLRKRKSERRGAAAAEMAVLLPLLAFLFVVGVDWCRIFYFTVTVGNCARNGAMHLCDPYATAQSPYSSVTTAALADANNLSPTPTVTSTSGVDSSGRAYVECAVSYSFLTLTNFPGVPHTNNISRTVRMYRAPQTPN